MFSIVIEIGHFIGIVIQVDGLFSIVTHVYRLISIVIQVDR